MVIGVRKKSRGAKGNRIGDIPDRKEVRIFRINIGETLTEKVTFERSEVDAVFSRVNIWGRGTNSRFRT